MGWPIFTSVAGETVCIELTSVMLACHQSCVRLEAGETCLCCLCMCEATREHVAKRFALSKFYNRQMRETDLGPVVCDKEVATYMQHVLTIDIPIRATIEVERDRFGEFTCP